MGEIPHQFGAVWREFGKFVIGGESGRLLGVRVGACMEFLSPTKDLIDHE
ncbi:hypothetical protein GCM10009555_089120 [Acrocarpospora macrocephala]|uniref:Uncharacterized protein n=1 Tax=Acrocarpospora macrocephala TaxID=150177 RepID=A0A5M3WXD6_9ACTN|nr:hypothetical protein Amac_077220 [Acrocarpospora macrocephala]